MHILLNPVFRRFSKEHDCLMVRKVILEVWIYFIKRMGELGLLDEYIGELLLPFCKILPEESNLELVTQICSTFARALGRVNTYSPHGRVDTKTNLAKRRKLYWTKATTDAKHAEIGAAKLVPLSPSNVILLLESLNRHCQKSSLSVEKKKVITSYGYLRGHIREPDEHGRGFNQLKKQASHAIDTLDNDINIVDALKLRVQELERSNKILKNVIQNMTKDGAKVLC
jgi:hypothetical protein